MTNYTEILAKAGAGSTLEHNIVSQNGDLTHLVLRFPVSNATREFKYSLKRLQDGHGLDDILSLVDDPNRYSVRINVDNEKINISSEDFQKFVEEFMELIAPFSSRDPNRLRTRQMALATNYPGLPAH